MASTDEDLANAALYSIGEKGTIVDLDTDTGELADLVNAFIADVKYAVQRTIPWACLKTSTALTASANTTSKYGYQHTCASTVLTVLNINSDEDILFERRGTLLLFPVATGYFEHTAKSDTVTAWSPLLVQAVVELLASKLCIRRTGSPQTALMLYQQYLSTLFAAAKAEIVDGYGVEYLDVIASLQQLFPEDLLRGRMKTTE